MKLKQYPISSSLTSCAQPPFNTLCPTVPDSSATVLSLSSSFLKNRATGAATPLNQAIGRSQEFFLQEQLPDGYWWAELESNVTISAEYLMLFHLLGAVDKERERKIVSYLLAKQTLEGFWTIYYGGPGDLSTTVEAYFALKLAGTPADHPAMQKARRFILDNGGIIKSRVFTKIFLALFGEFDWIGIPSIPVELMLLPNWAYFNLYELSSWSRATMVPLSLVVDARPIVTIPPSSRVQELYVRPLQQSDYTFNRDKAIFTWRNFFIAADRLIKVYEKIGLRPFRRKGIAIAEKWVLDHQEPSGDWGGIQPAMLNSVLALHTLGYGSDHPAMVKGLAALANFTIETHDSLHLQSCISPVWDTALALKALLDSEVPDNHPAVVKATEWLLEREVKKPGDWQIKSPELQPGGWAFEFQNDWYPDVDDSAFVLMTIKDVRTSNMDAKDAVIQRGIAWCLGMQSKNGGWGAFDKDNTKHLLNKIPFADLEALIDPPTADLTGRMLELLGNFNYDKNHPAVMAAIAFVKNEQEASGSWWGRWGVNHIYGTWSVLCGLAAIGENMSQPCIQRAVGWLESNQNPDGGWGESCQSYHDSSLAGKGESTASQSAWALLGLMAAGKAGSPSVIRGIEYLLEKQNEDGSWDEDQFTGTGFPKYFMIKYHIYRNCFPLAALGTYRRLTIGSR